MIGTMLLHYRILTLLGRGGMGEVYLAADTRLERQVALKMLPPKVRRDSSRLARFRTEAKAAARLNHPNIAILYALEETDDLLFISMEYVPGQPLSTLLPPDGTMVAYGQNGRLWIRNLNQIEPREISDTEGATGPFWSPQSDFVGYLVRTKDKWTLKKVAVQGGPGLSLCTFPLQLNAGAAWRPDGTIVLSRGALGLFEVSAQGGEPRSFMKPDSTQGEVEFWDPRVLPDGRTLVFSVQKKDRSIDLVVQAGDTRRLLVHVPPGEAVGLPTYSPTGHLVYSRRAGSRIDVWAVSFSLSTLAMTGEPFLVAQNAVASSVSGDGTLVYQSSAVAGSQQLVWVDRSGKVEGTVGQPQQEISDPALSPDGRYVANISNEPGRFEVYVMSFPGRTGKTQVSVNGGVYPRWGGHGNELFYVEGNTLMVVKVETKPSFRAGNPQKLFTGEQVGTLLYDESGAFNPSYDVTADGQRFVSSAAGSHDHHGGAELGEGVQEMS